MTTPEQPPEQVAAQRPLVDRLRAALVGVFTDGSWEQIADDHKKVGLPWRADLRPGSGKPKYVERVLVDLPDEDVISLARRAMDLFPERCAFAVEDALLWLDAGGVATVTEVTRLKLAAVLDGQRLHLTDSPSDVLGRFARSRGDRHFDYADDGTICVAEADPFALFGGGTTNRAARKSNHLALLDDYGFREWPDARLFRLLEFLVHPTVRQSDEQISMVRAFNAVLAADRLELTESDQLSGYPIFLVRHARTGVPGRPKNLLFASTGPKPELGFADAVNNDIVILRNGEHCLMYDETIDDAGLRWSTLVEWWAAREHLDPADALTRRSLAARLGRSLASEPERRFFASYFKAFHPRLGDVLPALLPQVYLHYDPFTLRELRARGDRRRLDVQRMDFLILLPRRVRVIVEIDGQQHYSTGIEASARPSPEEYARTVRGDRHLRLSGYEVYRFGGHELRDEGSCMSAVEEFFARLFRRHHILDVS